MDFFSLWDRGNQIIISSIMAKLNVDKNDERKCALIQYSLSCLLNEMQKVIILAVFFIIRGSCMDFFVAFVTITSLRVFLGGSHRKTILGCWIQSFLTFEEIIILSSILSVDIYFQCIIVSLGLLLIWKKLPLISEKRMNYGEMQRMKFKMKALSAIVIWLLVIDFVPGDIRNIILWAMCIQFLENLIVVIQKEVLRNK